MKKLFVFICVILTNSYIYSQSAYEEPVNIPNYNASDPEMMIIKSNSDWSRINDSSIRYFFVEPGDYSGVGDVKLTANGTSSKRRYIVLYNGNDRHPGQLPINSSNLARVEFLINGNYWVIDRMAYWDRGNAIETIQIKGGSHNIINRYLQSNVGGGCVTLYKNSHYNTVQNCRIERNDFLIDGQVQQDRAAFQLFNNYEDYVSITNTKILNNETYNFNDGFQTIRQSTGLMNINYEGTIVDSNHFYIDNKIYTDGNGHHDPDGNYAYAENAIDLKCGSDNPSNPMVISNNMFWGYRKADKTNSELNDHGAAIVIHYDVNNTEISNNLCYDSAVGIAIADPRNGYTLRNSIIKNNILYNILGTSLWMYSASNVILDGNLTKNSSLNGGNNSFYFKDDNTNISVINNMNIITKDTYGVSDVGRKINVISNNEYYRSLPRDIKDDSDIIHSVDPTFNFNDLIFRTDNFTTNSRDIIVPKVLKDKTTGSIKSNAGEDVSICSGQSTTLTASGGSSYTWNTGATTASITVSPNTTQTYTVTARDGSGNTDTDEVIVTVNSVTANAGSDRTINEGDSVTFTASGGDTYIWNTGDTGSSITVNPTSTSDYTVTVTKDGCDDTDSVKVIVNLTTGSIKSNAGEDVSICSGQSTTLTASGGSSYTWNTGATTASITVSPNTTQTYTVTARDGSGNTDTDEVIVTVNSVTANAGSDRTITEGDSVTFTASGGDTYTWNTGDTGSSITVSPASTSDYTVTVTKDGCDDTDSVKVTVTSKITSPPPAEAFAGDDISICLGESVTLNASGGDTYTWSTGDTNSSIDVNPSKTTIYTLSAVRGGTTDIDTITVSVENCESEIISDEKDLAILEMAVYPNPTQGELTIRINNLDEDANFIINDIKGSLIYSEYISGLETQFDKQIDLSRYSDGLYFVRLYSSEQYLVKKVMVQ